MSVFPITYCMAKKKDKLSEDYLENLLDDLEQEDSTYTQKAKAHSEKTKQGIDETPEGILLSKIVKNQPGIHSEDNNKTEVLKNENQEDISYDANIDKTKQIEQSIDGNDKTYLNMRISTHLISPANGGDYQNQTELHSILQQSENLRIAQKKILELEKEVERLRFNNEEIGAAGETLRSRVENLTTRAEDDKSKYESVVSSLKEEKDLLRESVKIKSKSIHNLEFELEKMQARLATNIQKVRFRERELENRLEIVKMENIALIRNKDEIILDLKRQIDQLNHDLERFKNKTFQVNKNMKEKNEVMRRTVKALRLALSLLEGHDESHLFKKVD